MGIAVVAFAFGLNKSLDKWAHFGNWSLTSDGRWGVLQTCAKWFAEIPLLGYGPGTFSAVFIVKTTGMNDAPPGYWQFAHDDYLQTFLEWGWLGLALWVALGFTVLSSALNRAKIRPQLGCSSSPLPWPCCPWPCTRSWISRCKFFYAHSVVYRLPGRFAMGEAGPTRSPGESGKRQRKRRHGGRHDEGQAGAP